MAPIVSELHASLDDLFGKLSDTLDRLPPFVLVAHLGEGEEFEALVDLRRAHPQAVSQPEIHGFGLLEEIEGFLVSPLVAQCDPGEVRQQPHPELVVRQPERCPGPIQILQSR